jgi:hypothetical protein
MEEIMQNDISIDRRATVFVLLSLFLSVISLSNSATREWKSFYSFYRNPPKISREALSMKPLPEEKKIDVRMAGFVPQILFREALKEAERLITLQKTVTQQTEEEEIARSRHSSSRENDNGLGMQQENIARNDNEERLKADIQNWVRDEFSDSLAFVAKSEGERIDMDFADRFHLIQDEKSKSPFSTGRTRQELVSYALKFVGNPYVYGGTSLTNGADCSGFTMSLFKKFGIDLPRTSGNQAQVGKETTFEKMKPGDLLFYVRGKSIGHVAMYIGDGKVVHASTKKTGIRISNYDYRKPYKVVSYFN